VLTLEEGTLIVRSARKAFFAFLEGNAQFQAPEHPYSRLREKGGAYVRVRMFDQQNSDKREIVLGFTGYPMPYKSLHQTVIDSSTVIAARNVHQHLDIAETSFEVTILSPPELLKADRPIQLASRLKLGRDVLMIVSPGFNNAIVLPQTAVNTCTNEADLLSECCTAAGIMADAWITSTNVTFYKFKAQIFAETGQEKTVTEISFER
jgi:uncharacterized protein (TIGR00296 family)